MGSRFSRTFAALAVVVAIALVGSTLVLTRPWSWCPADSRAASRIDLDAPSGDVMLGGRPYRIGGHALLDYMPRALFTPLDRLLYGIRGERHPLTIGATISASSREELGDPAFTCFRAIRESEVWARRPTTYGTQTLADGYPPGAQPPARNEAWRLAVANDGPEWSAGEQIRLELWARVNGRDYVVALPPFALMRGG